MLSAKLQPLHCPRFGRIADRGLLRDAGGEDSAEVGDSQQEDHEQRQYQAELDQRLAARFAGGVVATSPRSSARCRIAEEWS